MNDGIPSPRFDEHLLESLRQAYFDGSGPPKIGLFEENLACSTPTTTFAFALAQEQQNTYTMFQMLQSWIQPFSNPARTDPCLVTTVPGDRSTAISGPEVGIEYARQTFGCRYFEIYVPDLQHPGFADELMAEHQLLNPPVAVDQEERDRRLSLRASPNPNRGAVELVVLAPAPARIAILDATGRRVRTFPPLAAGESHARWDGRDQRRLALPAGLYFIVLEAQGRRLVRRVALTR